MKPTNQYEVKLLDGTRYKGQIAYRDDKMVVLLLTDKKPHQQLRLFHNGIVSIQELGWKRTYAMR